MTGPAFKISAAHYHRNGVCGVGFTVVLFSFKHGRQRQNAMATVFDLSGDESFDGYCSVLCLDHDGKPDTIAGMRGDHFEQDIREFLKSPAGQAMMFPHLAAELIA